MRGDVQPLYADPQLECMPLADLVRIAEGKLVESSVIVRAARSSLYRERWTAAGVIPADITSYAALRKLPYTNGRDLRLAESQYAPEEIVCSEHVRLWISTSGTTGASKWIPRSDRDLADNRQTGKRYVYLAHGGSRFRPGQEATFGLAAPAPFVTDSSAVTGSIDGMLLEIPGETIALNYTEAQDALFFALRRRPSNFAAFPSVAMRMAEGVAELAPAAARERLAESRSLQNLLAVLITKVRKVRPRDLVPFRHCVFAGEPLDPYRPAIRQAYGVEPFEVYSFSEFLGVMGDCAAHDGVHLWIDYCLPEIIPQSEIEQEEGQPGYIPQAIPLWEAEAGQRGEFVVTNFADAFPLVRYRTADLIELVSRQPCACGRTHPRIRVLHRTDDIVNLGLVRFSIFELQKRLSVLPGLGRWQLWIERQDYKPKAILKVEETESRQDSQVLKEQVLQEFLSLDAVKLGLDNHLIAEPEVQIVAAIEERRTQSGKLRMVVYAADIRPGGG
ncbi:MAG: GH3 auxin-responsive promoter family protein [bacterium]